MMGIPYNTLIVLIGTGLLGASAGLVGCFAVLRNRALTGDAIAHAGLPGVCLAFLVVGERWLPALLAGALLTGLLGILVISALRHWTRIKEDAAIGYVLSVFFGVGIVLIVLIQKLATTGSKAGLDSFIFGKTAGMTAADVALIAGLAVGVLVLVCLLYKEFKLIAFDPGFARVQGWPALLLDLLLMGLIAVAVVSGEPEIGVVFISAYLIIPSVTARFWTERLDRLLILSTGIGLTMGVFGSFLSAQFSLMPAGPIIVLVGAAMFIFSLVVAPRRGLVGHWLSDRRFRRDLDQRKLLRILFDLTEAALPDRPALLLDVLQKQRAWNRPYLLHLLADAEQSGHVRREGGDHFVLTDAGLQRAAEIARGYRLWELYLTEYADVATGTANLATESVETLLPASIIADLHEKLRRSGRWPRTDSVLRPEVSG